MLSFFMVKILGCRQGPHWLMLCIVMSDDDHRRRPSAHSRRAFLRSGAAGVGVSLTGGCGTLKRLCGKRRDSDGVNTAAPPQRTLRFGFIGAGGIGRRHIQSFSAAGVHVAALCDVDERELHDARDLIRDRFPGVRLYKDFRVMLADTQKLDAVVIATPDHAHGVQATHALRRNCDVFLETPLTHTLAELDLLEGEAERAGRLVLPGDCGCHRQEALRACEILGSGFLGAISQIHLWTNNPVWPQGGDTPVGSDPVPAELDWQLWLSGARPRPFKRFVYHRFNWRGWTDFGSGTLGDVGCRLLGFPFAALDLKAADEIERVAALGGTPASYPRATELRFRCESGVQKGKIELRWYDGRRMPPAALLAQVRATLGEVPGAGILIEGERGSWFVTGAENERHCIGLPGGTRMTALEHHELGNSLPRTLPHGSTPTEIFLRALHDRKGYNFAVDARRALHRTVLCGAVAQRIGGVLQWNERRRRFEENETANALMQPHREAAWHS